MKALLKIGYVIVLGALCAVVGFWLGGKLFPSNNHDMSDITQGFLQLGIGILGFVIGTTVGVITSKRFMSPKR